MSQEFPPCPASLKQIQSYLKTAQEHDGRDIIVSYWCRLYALQIAIKIATKQPDENKLLYAIMNWLETTKKENTENDAITNEVAAQAHLDNYALKLFMYADKQDRESNFGKNVVKAFYTSGIIYDILQTFGELSEEAAHNRKYAKWKATYIHNCLKNGETPHPGPMADEEDNENAAVGGESPEEAAEGVSPKEEESEPEAPRSNLDAADVLNNPEKLPSPPKDDEEHPGGFVSFVPTGDQSTPALYEPPKANMHLNPEQILKAQKYCKYAGSALNFDDVSSAVENLQKALHLLTTGQEP